MLKVHNIFPIILCGCCKIFKTIFQLEFYAEHKGKPFFDTLVGFMSSDFITGIELVGDNAIKRWRDLLGPTNTNVAK